MPQWGMFQCYHAVQSSLQLDGLLTHVTPGTATRCIKWGQGHAVSKDADAIFHLVRMWIVVIWLREMPVEVSDGSPGGCPYAKVVTRWCTRVMELWELQATGQQSLSVLCTWRLYATQKMNTQGLNSNTNALDLNFSANWQHNLRLLIFQSLFFIYEAHTLNINQFDCDEKLLFHESKFIFIPICLWNYLWCFLSHTRLATLILLQGWVIIYQK